MRQNPNSRRSRSRGGRKPGNSRNQIFDSNGPGARVRGNSAQIYEKYQQLARDASSSGDRVGAENFYQHAEHYYRMMEAAGLNRNGSAQEETQPQNDGPARNGEAVEIVGASQQPATEAAAVVADTAGGGDSEAQNRVPPKANSDSENSADGNKPARPARARRSNRSANGQSAPDTGTDTDTAESEEGSDPVNEDTNPVSA